MIAISVAYEYKFRQYDIVAAYTNASLPRAKVAELPEGFKNHNSFLLIKKALYGLAQSALLWQNHLQARLIEIGLFPVPGVNCLFRNDFIMVLFYVDDTIVVYHERDRKKTDPFEEMLMKKYETKPSGQINHFLGIRVARDDTL